MKLRFIKHLAEIYLVVGIGHNCYEYFFEAIPLQSNLCRAVLHPDTIRIPFSEAIEITDKNTLISLLVLYG